MKNITIGTKVINEGRPGETAIVKRLDRVKDPLFAWIVYLEGPYKGEGVNCFVPHLKILKRKNK